MPEATSAHRRDRTRRPGECLACHTVQWDDDSHGATSAATVSSDGAFVVFVSSPTNVAAGESDANGDDDVFLLERATGTVRLVSHAACRRADRVIVYRRSTGAHTERDPAGLLLTTATCRCRRG
jgi:hypothetical protein